LEIFGRTRLEDDPMPSENDDATKKAADSFESSFIAAAFKFFTSVLDPIKDDEVLRVSWGVEVLLFVILAFMIFFGGLTGDQRFDLALVIIVSVVSMFGFTAYRTRRQSGQPPTPAQETANLTALAHSALAGQAQKCLSLLTQINDANARIIARGGSGSGPWAKILTDTYNRVCETCYQRRLGTGSSDPYFDTICAEPDVNTVCVKKWELGETLDDYRRRLASVSPLPVAHDELELLIRRSVTQPDCTPRELDAALRQAIESAKRVL
jgi:hypothetical protein